MISGVSIKYSYNLYVANNKKISLSRDDRWANAASKCTRHEISIWKYGYKSNKKRVMWELSSERGHPIPFIIDHNSCKVYLWSPIVLGWSINNCLLGLHQMSLHTYQDETLHESSLITLRLQSYWLANYICIRSYTDYRYTPRKWLRFCRTHRGIISISFLISISIYYTPLSSYILASLYLLASHSFVHSRNSS